MRLKVAVVGGGIAGISAAHALANRHEVSLFERQNYLGGHTNTQIVEERERSIPVDTGFIVCNPTNYPNFYRFLREIGAELRDSDMCFGFYCDRTRIGYTGPALSEFAKRWENLFKPDLIRMFFERPRFNRRALRDFQRGAIGSASLGDYCRALGITDFFFENYLAPLGAAIWSSPDLEVRNFPAATFITFFKNHAMLELGKRPRWQTLVGGSKTYIDAFARTFPGSIRLNSEIKQVQRSTAGVSIVHRDGATQAFDRCVIAAHADQALQLLADPSPKESELLGRWRYSTNSTVLHTDTAVMPKDRRLWASWNYRRSMERSAGSPVEITYYMNRLQGLKTEQHYFVTLNRDREINPAKIIYRVDYRHPIYTPNSVASQRQISVLNGERHTAFCGSYMGYGFHEDAFTAGLDAAAAIEGARN